MVISVQTEYYGQNFRHIKCTHIDFFEKKIYFHKTNLQKNHTYNTKQAIYKSQEIKAKKRN